MSRVIVDVENVVQKYKVLVFNVYNSVSMITTLYISSFSNYFIENVSEHRTFLKKIEK